jgi:predicted lipoprotein with Yx(FWY)xxD motif
MRLPSRVLAITVASVVLVGLAACGDDDDDDSATGTTESTEETTTTEADTTTTAAPEEDTASTVATADSDLGTILVDGEGNTLYLFMPDAQGAPTCVDDTCAPTWPALAGPASAGQGADDSLLATANRPDGSAQVTYNGWPLYRFSGDSAPGDTNGQGFGDIWFAVGADGNAVTG